MFLTHIPSFVSIKSDIYIYIVCVCVCVCVCVKLKVVNHMLVTRNPYF